MRTHRPLLHRPILLLALLAGAANLAHAAKDDPAGKAMWRDLTVCAKPTWPPGALARGAGGKTTVAIRVDTSGSVTESRVDVSSGHADLDQAARDGIAQCRFHSLADVLGAPSGWRPMQFVWQKPDAPVAPPPEVLASTRAAADAGDATAQGHLGWWYQHGITGPVDLEQAESWYRRGADGGNAMAQFLLARLYISQKRAEDAVPWLRRAADGGDVSAKAWLAWAYRTGTGVTADDDEARRWQTLAADSGVALAQTAVGRQLLRDAGDKPGTDADRAAGVDWLAKAAAQQEPYGQLYLARSHELGNGTGQDLAKAVTLYRAALGRTNGQAEVYLGAMLEEGRGLAADPAAAVKLYRQAMAVPYGPAFYRYGRLLEQGVGVARDERLAIEAYLQGADLSDCDAMQALGRLYVARDAERSKAYEWIGRGIFCEGRRDALGDIR
jgi:TonB family protein